PRQYGRSTWVGLTADNLLQCCNNLCCNSNWVNILMWMCSVSSLSFYRHKKFITGSHIFPGAEPHFASFYKRHNMLSDDTLRSWILQHSLFNHNRSSPWQSLFSWLEYQFNRSAKFRTKGLQYVGYTQ